MSVVALLVVGGCAASTQGAADAVDHAGSATRARTSDSRPQCTAVPPAALYQFVERPDSAYHWQVVREERGQDGVLVQLSLRSQRWHGITWQHSLLLFLPSEAEHPELLLLVLRQGGPAGGDSSLRAISEATGTAAAYLFDLPNQPLFDGLEEDPLLAYTYSQYLRTGDESWPLLFPMVGTVLRGMDAVQEVAAARMGVPIRRYVVAGHSKRGHAAWLAAAADSRVARIIPIAIDVLNSREQIAHHRAVAGEISSARRTFSDVIDAADTPRGRCLLRMIDPFTYRAALAEPKLVVLGTNDDYTPTDALNLYWDDLPGPRSVLYLPNTSHAGANSHPAVNATAFAFVRAVAAGESLPEIEWSAQLREGTVAVRSVPHAVTRNARLWSTHASGRDFRDSQWSAVPLTREPGGAELWVGEAELPSEGFLAVFVEVELEKNGEAYRLSTPIQVIEAATGKVVSPR